jgi:hypothetical protein
MSQKEPSKIGQLLAAEYAGDSQDLSQILQMYSEMKIKELQNRKDPL